MFDRTRSLLRAADAARDARDWPLAQAKYAAALDRKPELGPIWLQYGHALKEGGRLDQGLEAYRRADSVRPNHAETLLEIASLAETLGRVELAIDHFERAAGLSGPASHAAHRLAALRERLRPPFVPRPGMPERLRFVNLGTTGTCNASCIHCPTGKAETAHVPRGIMPMELFAKIIDGIADNRLGVTDQIAFGLFGDALVDRLVVERAEYLRDRLPEVRLSVNTNGAAFNAAKHSRLNDLAQTIALHCESLDPETYNDLMRPDRKSVV